MNADVKIFGSCATGLALESSDVDLALMGFENVPKFEIPNILQILLENLVYFKWIVNYKAIFTASVPILKLVNFNLLYIFKSFFKLNSLFSFF